MIVSIHQPEHLPWLGLIHKINISDVYVILDNVQFKKNYFENRNRIYTHNGLKWLTLPVHMNDHISKKFYEMKIVDNWKSKYLNTIKYNYSKSPYFNEIKFLIDTIDNINTNNLSVLNIELISSIMSKLNINTKIIRASELEAVGTKTDLLIDILKKLNGNKYIVGKSGMDYMEVSKFDEIGVELIQHKFTHPIYKPFNFDVFTDYPSVIDVIANLGLSSVINYINNND